jgi:hypothetical protein
LTLFWPKTAKVQNALEKKGDVLEKNDKSGFFSGLDVESSRVEIE